MASASGVRRASSVVEDHGKYHSSCGYCKSSTSVAHGLLAYRLSVNDYQDLLDRGWRRSGMLLYKPNDRKTCCPPYTIRLEANAFTPSKEQKRVQRRWQRYLEGDYEGPQIVGDISKEKSGAESSNSATVEVDEDAEAITVALRKSIAGLVDSGELNYGMELPDASVRQMPNKLKQQLKEFSGESVYTSNAAFLVVAAAKRKLKAKIGDSTANLSGILNLSPESLADSLALKLKDHESLQSVNIEACKGHLNFYLKNPKKRPYKQSVQKRAECNENKGKKRRLEIEMRKSAFDEEEFLLYKRYQVAVHGDDPNEITERSYCRFLVETPLAPIDLRSSNGSVNQCSYGSFHQQYRIDGRLIAVGVVDVLPRCLSSKYLFWDPEYSFLSLGKYSVLQEIEWVQAAHKMSPLLQYYYLGYYIHSCPKMRYKSSYSPSELLCPREFRWVPFEVALPLISGIRSPLCICSPASTAASAEEIEGGDLKEEDEDEDYDDVDESEPDSEMKELLGNIPLLMNSRIWKLKDIESRGIFKAEYMDVLKAAVRKYCKLVGQQFASRTAYLLT